MTRIPLAAVIGHPVAHSRSPALHGHWLKRYDIAGHYVPIDVAAEGLETALRILPTLGFVGANVTIPHKESALTLADTATDRARRIGAANTLTFAPDGTITADNTDGIGFLSSLRQGSPAWQFGQGPALVLGAGGAARAVVDALLDSGVPKVLLANRTQQRANALAAAMAGPVDVIPWDHIDEFMPQAALLVNTTSLGMVGKPPLDLSLSRINRDATVTDLVYVPLDTPLLESARKRGCTAVDGLGMLLHQAAPGFEAWFGPRPDVDDELRAAVLSA